jgi:hypothetical protein
MTPAMTIALWRRRLAAAALLCAAAAGAGVAALTRVIAEWLGGTATQAVALALVAGALTAAFDLLRRLGGPLTPARVALWLEEQAPALQYALVASAAGGDAGAWCAAQVRRVDLSPAGWRAIARSLRGPAALAVTGGALLLAAPAPERVVPALHDALRPSPGASAALAEVTAHIVPPAYSGLATQRIVDPVVLHPLVGSALELHVPAESTPEGPALTARVDGAPRPVREEGGARVVALRVDSTARAIHLALGSDSRLVAVDPRPDSLPAVVLESPVRDTVLRRGAGTLALRARASDDLGLVSAAFEYIVSRGEGERFTFRTGTLGAARPSGVRAARLDASLDLASLDLAPGDVVHLRAVARDANDVTGPGLGVSDTRAIRIARAGEYDSVAVEAVAPPEADKALLSQRMLINLTEALVRRVPSLGRSEVVGESRRLSGDQARLRRQVSDLVFARLGDEPLGEHFHGDGHQHAENEPLRRNLTPEEVLRAAERATSGGTEATDFAHDETPVVAINRPLLEAYNAMWDAGRELDAGQPRAALPPMYAALAAIQKARAAERLYLRGTPPRVVVDVGRARLQGRERGVSAVRPTLPPPDPVRRTALLRVHRALTLPSVAAAADSLLLVRLSLAGKLPGAAAAIDSLVADLRAGRSAATGTERVRRTLAGGPVRSDSVSLWSGWR